VDQSKQGILFGGEDLERFGKRYGMPPAPDFPSPKGRPEHITTYIKRTTDALVEKCLTEFHANNTALRWDEDLVEYYREASEWAKESKDWKS